MLDHGAPYVELRQAQLRPNGRAGLFTPDRAGLDTGAGVDVVQTLLDAGARAVGTREDLLQDDGRARQRWGAIFDEAAERVPVIAYLVTRVLPVQRFTSAS